jgi:hypothetical protein
VPAVRVIISFEHKQLAFTVRLKEVEAVQVETA